MYRLFDLNLCPHFLFFAILPYMYHYDFFLYSKCLFFIILESFIFYKKNQLAVFLWKMSKVILHFISVVIYSSISLLFYNEKSSCIALILHGKPSSCVLRKFEGKIHWMRLVYCSNYMLDNTSSCVNIQSPRRSLEIFKVFIIHDQVLSDKFETYSNLRMT